VAIHLSDDGDETCDDNTFEHIFKKRGNSGSMLEDICEMAKVGI
jgi:hypothetical protein